MGKTKDYEHIHNTDDMLEAVVEFIQTVLPSQSFVIAGESYGGYLTRGILQKLEDRILGVAFVCPMIVPEKQDRIVPAHTIVATDQPFLATLTKQS